mgnify:CR=1 FL=1
MEAIRYPDHHDYGMVEMQYIMERAISKRVTALVTTGKDAVKIPTEFIYLHREVPLYVLDMEIQITSGEEAFVKTITTAIEKENKRTMKMIENEMNVTVPLEIIKASEIEPKEVKWLWYPYIPFGKVTLLQGDPGDGKSKLMLSVAALLSKGEPLPFTETEENEPVTIIYQTTEDDADDTVVPRFNSAGGNGENLIFIRKMKSLYPLGITVFVKRLRCTTQNF